MIEIKMFECHCTDCTKFHSKIRLIYKMNYTIQNMFLKI